MLTRILAVFHLTKLLIENNDKVEYIHFVRGKKDAQSRGFTWLLRQSQILLRFITILVANNNIRIVHINFPLVHFAIFRDTALVLISRFFRKKVIIHFQGGLYNMNPRIPLYLKILVNISIGMANKIISLGQNEINFLTAFYKAKEDKVIYIRNAVSIPISNVVQINHPMLRILYLGRIDKDKGLKEIILALEKLKKNKIDYNFKIAGDGPDKSDFLIECDKCIPDNYQYLGTISGDNKNKVLSEANIFLMPSYFKGLPYALLEAMAYKLVPIVTPVGSIPK